MEKTEPGSSKAWFMLPRFQFLPLTVIMVSLGTAIGTYEGHSFCNRKCFIIN
jgi:hypothetical protein